MAARSAEPPEPPTGLTAVRPADWIKVWRRVRAQPDVSIPSWTVGDAPVMITASVKSIGLFGCTFAEYDDGTRIFPSNEALGRLAGVTERTAERAASALCRLGFWWRYVDGSKQGRRGIASEYRLTIPDDILDRVPLLTPELAVPECPDYHPNSDPRISDPRISDPRISETGTPELNARNTRTEFAPPIQDPPPTQTPLQVLSLQPEVEGRDALSDQDRDVSQISDDDAAADRAALARLPGERLEQLLARANMQLPADATNRDRVHAAAQLAEAAVP